MAKTRNAQPKEERQQRTDDGAPLFESETAEQTFTEDPLFRFLKEKWRAVLWIVIIVFVVLYAKNAFEASRRSNLERGAEVFVRMHDEFQQLKNIKSAESSAYKDSLDRLKGYLDALQDEYEPYKGLGNLYTTLLAVERGQEAEIEGALAGLDWKSTDPADGRERMFAELAALAAARALLDQSAQAEKAKSVIASLARDGEYAFVSAALTYARLAQEQPEVVEAKELLLGIMQRHPEQSELLEKDLAIVEARLQ